MRIGMFLSLISIFFLGIFIQSTLLLNWDVSGDLLVAKRLLAGGHYAEDFFNLNPPLIFYLYLPAIMLCKVFPISLFFALPLYIFSLALISLLGSYFLLQKMFGKEDFFITASLMLAIAFIFFILPFNEVGEREHLMMILAMPYFLLVDCRLQKINIQRQYAIAIGFFAGIGFLIKPFFLLAPFFLELYTLYYQRRVWAWVRPEIIVFLLLTFTYVAFVLLFHRDYLHVILPLALKYYYPSMHSSWINLLINPEILYSCVVLLMYFFYARNSQYAIFISVLMVIFLSEILSYLGQQTYWSYHLYPFLSLAVLSSVFLLAMLNKKKMAMTCGFLATLLLSWPFYISQDRYQYGANYKVERAPLMSFIQNNAQGESIYALSSDIQLFPVVDYAKANYVSRFYHLFWLPFFAKMHYSQAPFTLQQQQDEKFLLHLVAADIKALQPKFIFVDAKQDKAFLSFPFDYLKYFLNDPEFAAVFKNYHYEATIEWPGVYRLAVYKKGENNG